MRPPPNRSQLPAVSYFSLHLLFVIYDTTMYSILTSCTQPYIISGTDPGFQVRGGALKKIAPSNIFYKCI
jgi:hypothetical protein